MGVKQECRKVCESGPSTWHDGCVMEGIRIHLKRLLHVILGADIQLIVMAQVATQLNAAPAHLTHEPLPGDGVAIRCQELFMQPQVDAHCVCKHQPGG